MGKKSSDRHISLMRKQHFKPIHNSDATILITGWQKGNILDAIADEIGAEGTTHPIGMLSEQMMDIRDTAKFESVLEQQGEVSTLINGAAIMDLKWFEDYSPKEVLDVMMTNAIAAYNISAAFVKYTINFPFKKYIVHIGSMAARVPLNGSAPYCMSKAALEMMCRCMAWELAPKNYNVLCVNPTNTADTPMERKTIAAIRRFRGITEKEALDYWNTGMIRGSHLSKGEIAKVVGMFVRGECDYLSGSAVCFTGGLR